ncbi:CHRD domain-containing protein [Roseisolibacter sp. H3M3-2]|uniref:CHRD domain-containing protein n=1 Tax=Roseisolibacter sp. H3M3-2 TaxID=3031323 RepID=UPI0023DB2CB7|nr:CHRD domain-containing protein [Roseisolibacter sp. H3M3-2]MDF1505239.1 CHRD domain-containing protein [Roseisolibacter sp. H3M3-2]
MRLRLALPALALLFACDDDEPTPPGPPTFTATLTGAAERPTPVATPATGSARVVVNGASVAYEVTVSGLTGAPRFAHIHAPGDANTAAGVIVNFDPAAVTGPSGTFSGTFGAADIVGQGGRAPISLDSLVALMRNGLAYVNVHTAQFGAGEVRGQLRLTGG